MLFRSKKIKVKDNPVISLNISASSNSVRTGDVVTLSSKMLGKKGKEINNLNPTYSFHGVSFDGSSYHSEKRQGLVGDHFTNIETINSYINYSPMSQGIYVGIRYHLVSSPTLALPYHLSQGTRVIYLPRHHRLILWCWLLESLLNI